MNDHYKLTLCSSFLYKEIEIQPDDKVISIGTLPECEVRLKKDLFFFPISLVLKKENGTWNIFCSDNTYFSLGDIRKLYTKKLNHGDEFFLKYRETDADVCSIQFCLDFDYSEKDYGLEIDIAGNDWVKIGGTTECDIRLVSEYVKNDSFSLAKQTDVYIVSDNHSKYGIYVNGVKITNSKKISDGDFIALADFSFFYKDHKLYTSHNPGLYVNGLTCRETDCHSTHFNYPKFNRNTRIQYELPNDKLEIQNASQKPKSSKRSLLMSLIPSIIMLAMTIVLRGIIGGGGTFVIYSAVAMSMGIVMSVVTYLQDKKNYKKEFQNRIESYNEYIATKRQAILLSRQNELQTRKIIYESLDRSINEAIGFGRRLFEKAPGDMDFLDVYLGDGRIESGNQVKYKEQDFIDSEDPLASIPQKVSEEFRYLDDAPVVSDFFKSNGVGIVGESTELKQMLTNITLDLALRHFYNEVKFAYILNEFFVQDFDWLRYLRNVYNAPLDLNNIICDDESYNVILEHLYVILSSREIAASQPKKNQFDVFYIVFVTDVDKISSHPISKYFKNASEYGFTFVFLEEYEENIPAGCNEIIRLQTDSTGELIYTNDGKNAISFKYPQILLEKAKEVAYKIGAIEIEEVSLEAELTKNITLFEMLDIISVDDLDLSERWEKSVVYKSLAAPLGVRSKNQIVYLDIGDKANAHGPHGLVAGTTGSGKSEILQTYILSMATLFHPYEVGFVIIDFKGGGMANQFKDLPHIIGTITNIDGREINRSLLSIKAELVKRQELFSEAGVNHINDYIKLYKAGSVKIPMPHLIMIVDEFAELKAEYPDFMKELISTARIGRTLGVHLILATQKPAGVVDAQIWSNSKFKLCLKVQTREDSNEVLKTPLAAEIVEPGRAYFQVGNNEIFELFQSAYSGAPVPQGNEAKEKIFSIFETNLWGKKTLVYTNKKTKVQNSESQLQAIVQYVHDYCARQNIEPLAGICLPPLAERISTNELKYQEDNGNSISVPIGIFDDPEQQMQGSVDVDLSKENVYIVGSSQMGKTVLLQTLLYGLTKQYTPEQVNFYIVDCGSMVLKIFEDSKHCGGVVLSNEEDKCINLFKFINKTIIQRKKVLSAKGIGSYASYLGTGNRDMPLIAVIIDNIAAFKEYFSEQYEELNGLVREAQGVGLSFVFTSIQSSALNYRVQANFSKKIVLNCNDTGEYSNVFGHCKDTPRELPGRGLVMIEKRILEYQTAIFGTSPKESERSEELMKYIGLRNSQVLSSAAPIPMIPDKLMLAECMNNSPELFKSKGVIPIGMDFADVRMVFINTYTQGHLALIGDAESSDMFIQNFLSVIAKTIIFHNLEAIVIDDKNRKLRLVESYGFVKQYSNDTSDSLELIDEFCNKVFNRIDSESNEENGLLLVINSIDVLRKISQNKEDSKKLSEALKSASSAGVFILISGVENQPVSFNSPEYLKTIKDERKGILFAPLRENKIFETTGRIKSEISFDSSMGYRFEGSKFGKIKIFNA